MNKILLVCGALIFGNYNNIHTKHVNNNESLLNKRIQLKRIQEKINANTRLLAQQNNTLAYNNMLLQQQAFQRLTYQTTTPIPVLPSWRLMQSDGKKESSNLIPPFTLPFKRQFDLFNQRLFNFKNTMLTNFDYRS